MPKQNLTDRFIRSQKPASIGKRHEYGDAIVPGLALRVTDRGHKSFVLVARYPTRPKNPTRRTLGDYGAMTLDQARIKARRWLELIAAGVDPRIDEERLRVVALRRQANTFAAVATDFLDRHATGLRKEKEARTIIEREFVKRWGARPITDITVQDASIAIRDIVGRGALYQAHNALGWLRGLFNWAIGTGEYGVEVSPIDRLKPGKLIGKREARERILSEDELRAVWSAAGDMGYPYGPLFRLLILTGQREREVADLVWSEVDIERRLWTIPAARMKGGRAHEVPLTFHTVDLLKSLPRFTAGDFAFTTTAGAKPVNGFSKAKVRLDKYSGVSSFVIHDLRRTMRTHLSALPVQDLVRELVIAHARPGLHKVYDQHTYQDEKRHCLELWNERLSEIINPPQSRVVDIAAFGTARIDGRSIR
jgi:integrase